MIFLFILDIQIFIDYNFCLFFLQEINKSKETHLSYLSMFLLDHLPISIKAAENITGDTMMAMACTGKGVGMTEEFFTFIIRYSIIRHRLTSNGEIFRNNPTKQKRNPYLRLLDVLFLTLDRHQKYEMVRNLDKRYKE